MKLEVFSILHLNKRDFFASDRSLNDILVKTLTETCFNIE